MFRRVRSGFTLVEILIVVIILGILAAIATPQLVNATQEAASKTTYSELQKIRRHMEVYMAVNNGHVPEITAGDGTWGELVGHGGEYMSAAPTNAWVGGANARTITFGIQPDVAYHKNYGWIFNPATGDVWAAAFDADDHPIMP